MSWLGTGWERGGVWCKRHIIVESPDGLAFASPLRTHCRDCYNTAFMSFARGPWELHRDRIGRMLELLTNMPRFKACTELLLRPLLLLDAFAVNA